MRRSALFVTSALMAVAPAMVEGGGLPSRFTLGRYVPNDVWLYLHGVHNPERAWIEKQWADVFDALAASGIDRDLTSMLLSLPGQTEQDRAEAQATLDKWTTLIKAVDWAKLCSKEFAYAQRVAETAAGYHYFFLTRTDAPTAEANLNGLVAILKEVAALKEGFSLSNRKEKGVTVWSLRFGDNVPMSVELFRKDDILGLTTGREPAREVISLMAGDSQKGPIVTSKRFAEALSQVPPPEDFVSFFDTKLLLRDLRGMITAVARKNQPAGEPDHKNEGLAVVSAIEKILNRCDVFDYVLETMETDGRRELHHSVIRLQSNKRECALACCFLNRTPFKRFDKYIPAEATGFSMNGLVDLEALYKLAMDVIKTDIPNGEEILGKWDGILASVGFDPQRDLFSWWSGEIVSVTMPPAVVTPMGGADSVLMIRVKDAKLAAEKVDSAINHVSALVQGEGQMLMVTPADVRADGFKQITHPMFAMFIRPVIGVKGEWLMVGTSSAPINKCLAVADGKAPSILKNERFRNEGIIPKGPVMAASFRDTSSFGQELGQAVGMMGMFSGIASAAIPPGPESEQAKKMIQKVATIVMKLGPVLQKINFYSSESSVTRYDGATMLLTEKVVTYKTPQEGDVKTAEAQ